MSVRISGLSGLGMSKRARSYISRKIRLLIKERYKPRQAVRIAFEMARKKGYRVPRAS